MRNWLPIGMAVLLLFLCCTGCPRVPVDVNVDMETIHIIMDINIKIDRELDDFFDFEDEIEAAVDEEAGGPAGEEPETKPPEEKEGGTP